MYNTPQDTKKSQFSQLTPTPSQSQQNFQPQVPQYINPFFFDQFQPFINPYGSNFNGYQPLNTQSTHTFDAMHLYNQAQTVQSYYSLSNILNQLQSQTPSMGQNQGQVQNQQSTPSTNETNSQVNKD